MKSSWMIPIAMLFVLGKHQQVLANSKTSENLSTQTVTLKGRAETRTFYGPPGYGETPATDSRETVWVLFLKKPLGMVIPALSASRYSDEITLQLIVDGTMAKGLEADANCTEFSGKLLPRLTGHDHTDVVMHVNGSSPCRD